MLFAKQFLQIIDENASNSRTNQKNSRFIDRFFENIFRNNVNVNRDDDYNRSRKTYVIDEQNEKQDEFKKKFSITIKTNQKIRNFLF